MMPSKTNNLSRSVLVVAGSDPSGGAGIQADLKTLTSLGVYGMTAITALTVQNTKGVSDIHEVPIDIVKKWVPITYEAFEDYRVGGTQLSAKEILILKKIIKGETVDPDAEGISKREWGELQKKFDL